MIILKIVIILLCIVGIALFINYLEKKEDEKHQISFKDSTIKINLPIISLCNNGYKLNFLLDTGSDACIINKNDLINIDYTKLNNSSPIFGMEGNIQQVESCIINISHKDLIFSDAFQIVDMQAPFDMIKEELGENIHGIIGNSFLEKYSCLIDYKNLIAYLRR